ncbi:MAG: tRNA (adenosine(37)-N6)-dimethylallyltransferase MiaA [Muribaculaceae bacterium]|nr:tRNA (adenosine(37)-N6)-dimethylallyltransferase MiaA [Muribaculaceae bacterium]
MREGKIIYITGPTATGKTGRAVALASALDGEIVSADSRQVYTGMDLGTGKDLEEYGSVPYHMIDVTPAGTRYNLYQYVGQAWQAIEDIENRCRQPIVCGGTGLYVETLVKGIRLPEVPANPELRSSLESKSLAELTEILSGMKRLHNVTDVDTVKRAVRAIEIEVYYKEHPEAASATRGDAAVAARSVVIGVDIPRDVRRSRITERLHKRLDAGMVDEVRRLLDNGVDAETLMYYGLEYKFLTQYVLGLTTYQEMVSGLETAIHQFAKRQMTWFRGMERRGVPICWIPYNVTDAEFVERAIEAVKS